jgi:Tfp pilus assembly protein PilW
MKKNKTSGATLFEIIVSAVLLAVIMASLINLFVAARRHILHSRSRTSSMQLGRAFMDPLWIQIRQDQWIAAQNNYNPAVNNLSTTAAAPPVGAPPAAPGAGARMAAPVTVDGIVYNGEYCVNGVGVNPQLRRVTTVVRWNEPQ